MRNIMKVCSLLLALVMVLSLLPGAALPVYADDAIPYVDAAAVAQTPVSDYSVIDANTTTLTEGWWVVKEDVRVETRINVSGSVNLILCDGATLTVPKGVSVNDGNNLTIWSQAESSGALTINGTASYNAGIGGVWTSSGVITINGGIINAVGGTYAAGIGGGCDGGNNYDDDDDGGRCAGTVVINGGTVTAAGGWGGGAGIGSAAGSLVDSNVTINGGIVNASGSGDGAGIGGGFSSSATVTVNGGTVRATGGASAAGIGGGGGTGGWGTVTINGGTVNASGGACGIGGGSNQRNTVSLGWTDGTDSITASSYVGTVTLSRGFTVDMQQYLAGPLSDASVLAGKTLTPLYRTLTYLPGEPIGSGVNITEQIGQGASAVLQDCGFSALAGYAFCGWKVTVGDQTAFEILQPGDRLTVTENTTAEAIWSVPITSWADLQAAINNASDGDVITLGQTLTAGANDSVLVVSGDKSITINLNGYSLKRQLQNSDPNGHVLQVYKASTLTLTDSVGGGQIIGGYATNGGGINNSGRLIVDGVMFAGNKATNGGAIMNYNTLEVRDCVFRDSSFSGNGGAICNIPNSAVGVSPTVTVSSSHFVSCTDSTANTDDSKGGAIYNEGTFTVRDDSIIDYCTADDAGAIYNAQNATLTLNDVELTDNESLNHGGGAIVNYGTAELTDCTVEYNEAHTNGGGIWNTSTLTVTGGSFGHNEVSGAGGAIWTNGTATISGATFSNNTGAINGGAIANHGRTSMTNCSIADNTASAAGGAIFTGNNGNANANVKVTVTGGIIMGNTAPLGGGIYIDSDTAELIGAAVMGNTASDKGGGVYVNGSSSTAEGKLYTYENASISQNTAGDGGGIYIGQTVSGLTVYKGKADLRVTAVSENVTTAHGGGGITNYGELYLNNSEITDNTAVGKGGGVFTANKLTVLGGSIGGNKTNNDGGGVYVYVMDGALTASTAEFTNVTVSDNEAVNGGGICTCEADPEYVTVSVTVKGTSSITDNEASNHGGGICNGARLILKDSVTVTGNTSVGCGGGIWTTSDLEMKDKIVVKDNTGAGDDLYLKNSQCITITGALDAASSIGLSFEVPDAILTSGYGTHNADTDPASIFFGPEGYVICLEEILSTPVSVKELRARLTETISYYDPVSSQWKSQEGCFVVSSGSAEWTDDWYVVTGNIEINQRITVTGDVNLILTNGAELIAAKGISVPLESSFTIWGQVEDYLIGEDWRLAGKLYTFNSEKDITPDEGYAGIGGVQWSHHGPITVNGGSITALGGKYGPGIGTTAAAYAERSVITINSGVTVAGGGEESAGIGGGSGCSCPTLFINGGGVSATGGGNAAGIGGGHLGVYRPITITGGEVFAFGYGGAGIGCGYFDTYQYGSLESQWGGGLIDIQGGKVVAETWLKGSYDNAGAFVYGDHPEEFMFHGGVHLYDDAKVTYIENYVSGQTQTGTVFSSGWTYTEEDLINRVDILMSSYSVTIEPCDHAGATYAPVSLTPELGHVMHCTTCNLAETIESHSYDSTGKCTVCGYEYTGTLHTVSFDANGGTGTMDPTYLADGSTYRLPDCGFTAPTGKLFLQWSVRIGSNTPVPAVPGDQVTVTGDTIVQAVWGISASFVGHSLSLNGDIGVNFIVDLNGNNAENFTVTFTWDTDKSRTVALSDATLIPAGEPYAGCHKVTAPVAAKEMTDTVTATICQGSTEIASNAYSVKEYCDTILADTAHATYSVELWNLARAMLLYGAKAQTQFGYRTDDSADKDLADKTLTPLDADEITGLGTITLDQATLAPLGLQFYGTSLVLESETTLRLYFKVTDAAAYAGTAVYRNGEKITAKQNGSYIYFEIADIAAKEVLNDFTLDFGTVGNAGTEQETFTKAFDARFNAGAYIGQMLKPAHDGEPIQDTVTALYRYSKAALAYFGS